jgi:hypothetical protein
VAGGRAGASLGSLLIPLIVLIVLLLFSTPFSCELAVTRRRTSAGCYTISAIGEA